MRKKACAEEAAAKSQAQEIRGGGQDCCLASDIPPTEMEDDEGMGSKPHHECINS